MVVTDRLMIVAACVALGLAGEAFGAIMDTHAWLAPAADADRWMA
jgi:hypothetical protein